MDDAKFSRAAEFMLTCMVPRLTRALLRGSRHHRWRAAAAVPYRQGMTTNWQARQLL